MTPYLIVPGWAGSGPDHWQTHWERDLEHARRVEMGDWLAPRRVDWVAALDAAIQGAVSPPILVAHSLGCQAVAHWAATARRPVQGALLVAPADLDRIGCPPELVDFGPVPRNPLSFPSYVITSDNDPCVSVARARQMATDWGSALTVLPGAGHINAESG